MRVLVCLILIFLLVLGVIYFRLSSGPSVCHIHRHSQESVRVFYFISYFSFLVSIH